MLRECVPPDGTRPSEVEPVRRYLVIANQTLGGDQLVGVIRERMAAGPSHFHLLVPATPADELDPEYLAHADEPARPAATPGTEGLDRLQARHLLEDELDEVDHTESSEDHGRRLARERLAHELRSEEHTSELQSRPHLVCRLLLAK